MRLQASDAARGIGGRLLGPDVEFEGISFDTRSLVPGQLFVPIVDDRDGHDFIGDAYAAGAALHLTSVPDRVRGDHTSIEVADTAAALMALAKWARARSAARVVGITGSVGKTSTKDLVAAAVGSARRTAANERSFNNEQGLPATILNSPDDTEVLVLEMGMRGFGEISRLCEVARPEIGVVTSVGHSHTELVGGVEGVARVKRELVEALPASGTAVLNADDHRVSAMAGSTGASVITFGRHGDVRLSGLELDERARPSFVVDTPWGSSTVRLAVAGAHMASNAAAAIAVAGVLGVDLGGAVAALRTAEVSGMRMEVTTAPSGAIVVNDAYNANPTSMAAALDAVAAMAASRRIAVLGLMAEIDEPGPSHLEVAAHARSLGIDVVPTGVDLYGIEPVDDPIEALGPLGPGDVVLVKASRAAGLESIVEALLAR